MRLDDRLVELEVVDSVSDETVRTALKKTKIKPWLKKQWCIPPDGVAEFVAAMEDVLNVYHRPYGERRPLVCLDEANRQLMGEATLPLPVPPGRPARGDYEYVRNGTANLFMVSRPLLGWRSGRSSGPPDDRRPIAQEVTVGREGGRIGDDPAGILGRAA